MCYGAHIAYTQADLEVALQHVAKGERLIVQQETHLTELRAEGQPTDGAERYLADLDDFRQDRACQDRSRPPERKLTDHRLCLASGVRTPLLGIEDQRLDDMDDVQLAQLAAFVAEASQVGKARPMLTCFDGRFDGKAAF